MAEVRYAVGGRAYPRGVYYDGIDGVFHWASQGGSPVPPPPATHKRLFHNWYYYTESYQDVFIWQNAGGSPTPPPGSTQPPWSGFAANCGRLMGRKG